MEVTYYYVDIARLIKAEIEAKGMKYISARDVAPISNKSAVTVSYEWAEAEPSVFEKAREYLEQQKAKDPPAPAPVMVAQPAEPAKKTYEHTEHYIQAEERKYRGRKPGETKEKLAEKQEARAQVTKERVAELRGHTIDPEAQDQPALPVKTAAHEHVIKVYPVTGFVDPDQPGHKHFRRMCTSCGWSEQVECLACKALESIKELKEVVAPSPATFPEAEERPEAATTRAV